MLGQRRRGSGRRREEGAATGGALGGAGAEHIAGTLQKLVLPGNQLVRVHVILLGNLGHRLLALQRLKRYPGLECGGHGFVSVFASDLLLPQGECTAVRPLIVVSEKTEPPLPALSSLSAQAGEFPERAF